MRVGGSKLANQMALKIGLDVVPKGHQQSPPKNKRRHAPRTPTIEWNSQVEHYFWGHCGEQNPSIQRIENDEDFPLFHLSDVLSPESLERAFTLLSETEEEEIEQHELVSGRPSCIRRSLVSQLDPSGELLELLISSLPAELLNEEHHPYEDGSAVAYRCAETDFYDVHHDSFSPGDATLRKRQRAYTVLIYLQTPPGPPSNGGTEFPKLIATNGVNGNADDAKGLIVKPQAGDALVWPNFDSKGKPERNSVHRALSVRGSQEGQFNDDAKIGKVVINLWFEGLQVLKGTK
eukprot:CAMPEP_0113582190 /NCGR_PEP_ID=MMETSP0015_2-20120614/31756_1 /TAXON_ID=2838 /ORGANISM="Odontella" /LENGTH=290 /DNA_ID=CAMNT_0000486793 /DNA_START=120 /DNA_END=992 /DNA_ORIENTATION=+ /assembly_acc=CAM_ASM_000160